MRRDRCRAPPCTPGIWYLPGIQYLVFGIWYLPSSPLGQGLLGGTPFWHSQISPDHGWIIASWNHDGENYDDEDEDPANVGNNDDT